MKHSFYRMRNNVYLGNCIAIVTQLDSSIATEGFTRPEVLTFIKPTINAYSYLTDIGKMREVNLFEYMNPILRIGSECMFGIFGDTHCECEPERLSMLRLLNERGGVYMHLPQEAQGMGLSYKAEELHLQVSGYLPDGSFVKPQSQVEAAKMLKGTSIIDTRNFEIISHILSELALNTYTYELVSKDPQKINTAKITGIHISKTLDISSIMTADNLGEYLAKWLYKKYTLTVDEIIQITDLLNSTEVQLPTRAVNLLNEARFALETNENSITANITAPSENLLNFLSALKDPKNPSVLSGGQSHLWSLLEGVKAYDEFQYELVLSRKLNDYLINSCNPEGQVRLWHELNNYFYLPLMPTDSRDLKMRLTYDMENKFVAARLIHKIKLGDNFFRIRSINFSDPSMLELLRETVFKDYDQSIIESITNPYCYSDNGLKIIIKKYSHDLRTLSLEGQKNDVIRWRQEAEDAIGARLEVINRNQRNFAPRIIGEFKLAEFMKSEFESCRRYFKL